MVKHPIQIKDDAIRDGLEARIEPPFSEEKLRGSRWLIVSSRVRSVEDLVHLPNLKKLKLQWSCAQNYSAIGKACPKLDHIDLRFSTVREVGFAGGCPQLKHFWLVFNHVEDLTPLLDHPNLENMSLDIRGNPLTDESFYEVLPRLEERLRGLQAPYESVWKLQRRMWEEGHRASYAGYRGYSLVVQPLACELDEEVQFRIKPDELERELSVDGADIEEIAHKYWTPPYSRDGCTERGDADEARQWIEAADLSDDLADGLTALVDRLGEATFAREQRRVFEVTQRNLYGWKPLPEPDRPGLPHWFCQWRRALAYVEGDGGEMPLRLSDDDAVMDPLRGEPMVLRPMGLKTRPARRALTDRHRAFPVAWIGADARDALVIRLGETDDRGLYLIDTERIFEWSFDPFDTVAFDAPERLVDAIEGLADTVDGRLAELDADPPELTADRGQLHTMDAHQARETLEEADLDGQLASALGELVDDFDELMFHREDHRRLEYYEVQNQARFPGWYRALRTTVAHPLAPDKTGAQTRVKLHFKPGSYAARQGYSDCVWKLSPPGVHLDHLRHKLIDRYGALPIGHETHKILAIRLDESDPAIYAFDPTLFGADEDFDPFETRVFDDPAELVRAVVAVGKSGKWFERSR